MDISDLALHGVTAIPAPTHQTGNVAGSDKGSGPKRPPRERVTLSREAENLDQIRRVAAGLVGRLHGDLSPGEQRSLRIALEQGACVHYGDRLAGEPLPAEVLQGFMPFVNERR